VRAADAQFRFVHREIVLVTLLVAIASAAFVVTRAVAAGNQRLRLADAAAWYARGEDELSSGHLDAAIDALRRATARNPQSRAYQLGLAKALAAGGQQEAAERVLANLRESSPEDPSVNLELARLSASRGDVPASLRFYQSVLNALSNADRVDERRAIRLELIRFLLERQQPSRALSELLILTVNLPDDPHWQVRVGQLYLDAGDPKRALDLFSKALGHEPRDADALAGAGEAAFETGDYSRARRYLTASSVRSDQAAERRVLSELVLASDPLAKGLALDERRRRLTGDLGQAGRRLDECLSGLASQSESGRELRTIRNEVADFASTSTPLHAAEARDRIESGAEIVDRAERASEKACGEGSPADRALLLVGRLHRLDQS